jgi:hypothetical protein
MLEPFLRHIFSVFDNSRQISTSAVRDHSVWNPEIAVTDLAGGCLCSFPCTQPVATDQSGGKEFRVDIGHGRQ